MPDENLGALRHFVSSDVCCLDNELVSLDSGKWLSVLWFWNVVVLRQSKGFVYSTNRRQPKSRALHFRALGTNCISSNSDWFIGWLRFVLIGHLVTQDYIRFFYIVQWKPVNAVTNGPWNVCRINEVGSNLMTFLHWETSSQIDRNSTHFYTHFL